jgi:CheY-like chemotaxis protein
MALKILTVDDSKTIRTILKKSFQPFDCEVFEAENGVEGLAAAMREKPDLIVLDITMPVMDGKEMLEKLKQEPSVKDIPVIMLTAEAGKDNVMQIVKMGIKDYMVKPFKGELLIQKASKIVKLEPKKEKEFFIIEGDIQYLVLPAGLNSKIISEVMAHLKTDMVKASEAGKKKLILDLSKLGGIDMPIIQLIISIIEKCRETQTRLRTVGNSKLNNELKGIHETSELPVYLTTEEAKQAF